MPAAELKRYWQSRNHEVQPKQQYFSSIRENDEQQVFSCSEADVSAPQSQRPFCFHSSINCAPGTLLFSQVYHVRITEIDCSKCFRYTFYFRNSNEI